MYVLLWTSYCERPTVYVLLWTSYCERPSVNVLLCTYFCGVKSLSFCGTYMLHVCYSVWCECYIYALLWYVNATCMSCGMWMLYVLLCGVNVTCMSYCGVCVLHVCPSVLGAYYMYVLLLTCILHVCPSVGKHVKCPFFCVCVYVTCMSICTCMRVNVTCMCGRVFLPTLSTRKWNRVGVGNDRTLCIRTQEL